MLWVERVGKNNQ